MTVMSARRVIDHTEVDHRSGNHTLAHLSTEQMTYCTNLLLRKSEHRGLF